MSDKKPFEILHDRLPTDAEKLNLYKIKDALKLPTDDTLWGIFIALDYHKDLYEKIPEKIMEAHKEFEGDLEKLREYLESGKDLHSERLKYAMLETLDSVSDQVSKKLANSIERQTDYNQIKTASFAIIIQVAVMLFVSLAGFYAYPVMNNLYDGLTLEEKNWLEYRKTAGGEVAKYLADNNDLVSVFKEGCEKRLGHNLSGHRTCKLIVNIDKVHRNKNKQEFDAYLWKYKTHIIIAATIIILLAICGLIMLILHFNGYKRNRY
jgi:hypothetical protein